MPWLSRSRTGARGKRKSEGGASGSTEKVQKAVQDVQQGVEDLSLEEKAATLSCPLSAAGIFEDDAVLLGRSSPDLDDPDAPGPSASGMPGPSTAGQSADAQPNMQASDMEPEVSNGVQGADSEMPKILKYLTGLSEEELQAELEGVQAAISQTAAFLQELELVTGLMQATKPSMKRTADEARARLLKLSQLQYRLIKYQSWKANLTPIPCFDGQVCGAAQHLEQELLSTMEATSMVAVEEALGQLGCPGSLNMNRAIIESWVEEIANEHQQYCVELATLESSWQEAKERESSLQQELDHLEIKLATINRLLLDLQVQAILPALSKSSL